MFFWRYLILVGNIKAELPGCFVNASIFHTCHRLVLSKCDSQTTTIRSIKEIVKMQTPRLYPRLWNQTAGSVAQKSAS